MSVRDVDGAQAPGLRRARSGRGVYNFLLFMGYAALFSMLHWTAQPWGGLGYFSLWYPAAGLRFAFLWHKGVRLAPHLMVIELLADWTTGAVPILGPNAVHDALGVLRPGASTAMSIWLVRHLCERKEGALCAPPMPLGLAALLAPLLSGLIIVPLEALWSAIAFPVEMPSFLALTGMVVGDLLGILVLAPPLLWLAVICEARKPPRIIWPSPASSFVDSIILGLCLMLTLALWSVGLGIQSTPAMLAGAWIGLRHGRGLAWFVLLADLVLFLPYSALELEGSVRLKLHLGIAGVVIVTWLAGCFADAQVAARKALDKRNRLLFQAERLKTLRAMSVAVIHEISQPLSTLAIEAGHLHRQAEARNLDIAESAALVDRKARALSDLVRRLRRFGGRDVDEPSPIPVVMLVSMAHKMVLQDAQAAGRTLVIGPVTMDLVVHGQEIELAQALVNLLRNALAETRDGTVSVQTARQGQEVTIAVVNACSPETARPGRPGMGVGLMIVRSIVEAHDGRLICAQRDGITRFTIALPICETVA